MVHADGTLHAPLFERQSVIISAYFYFYHVFGIMQCYANFQCLMFMYLSCLGRYVRASVLMLMG